MEKLVYDMVLINRIKPRIKRLYKTSEPIINYFNRQGSHPEMVMVSVLLQNAYACDNLDEIRNISSLIRGVANYSERIHVISWVSSELDFCIMGEELNLDYEIENKDE